ncbi:M16 family metallopeptidase [Pseudaestuariivita sp.]|uniref:M16 family metallopeptidase n=1 Tax=Pseudaestuariivita sp. TaxID=2211669 RepID=UPI004058D5DD
MRWISQIVLCCTLALAGTARADILDQVTTFTLDNGMDVVVIEDHRAPAVVHMMWYRVGSADEPAGASGVAHFLEHLMFKGTENMEAGEFSQVVAANGGSDNAFTSFDYTAYFQRVAADRLSLMMQMEADRMQNLRLTETDILTEREVIIEERNQRTENDPGALFREQRMAAQYLNHRYGVPIIGWRHEMSVLDMDDVMSFYEAHYAPNNAILIVAGDVTPDEVRALAMEHYAPIPANPAIEARDRVQEPPQQSERRLTFSDPRVAQPYVIRSYLAPERDAGDQREAAALYLLGEVLGGGQTSVLAGKLQFEAQKAVYASAWHAPTRLDDTIFSKVMVPVPGVSLEEAEALLDQAIAEFLEEGVDEAQLDRIKRQLKASQIYARDNVSDLANLFGRALTSGLTVEDIGAWPDLVQSITGEEIIAAAKRTFVRERAVTGYLMQDTPEVSQ